MLQAFQNRKNDFNTIPLLLSLLGKDHHQEPVYRTHGVPINQVFFCKSGQGEVLIDSRKYVIDKSQCFVILKDIPHEYHCTSGEDWVLDIIGFNGAIVPLLLRTLKLNTSGAYLLGKRDLIESHVNSIVELAANNDKNLNMLLSQKLYCLLTDLSKVITSVSSAGADYGNPTITQVIDYIESNYSNDISLENLAEIAHRTPEYLCNIFKKCTGSTPVGYITSVRLIHAMTLLVQEPSLPVNQVAIQCGFRSPSYFGKVFAKHYGMTPSDYRMKHIM